MKKKGETKLFITIVFLIIFLSAIGSNVIATPVIDEITYEPEKPTPKSTITFTATVSDEDIESVWLTVQECNDVLCFLKQNVSMTQVDTSRYRVSFDLTHDDTTYVKYYLVIESGGAWYDFKNNFERFNITTEPNGNGNGNGTNGNGDNGSPGFEVVAFFIAVTITAMVILRKRLK